MSVRAKPNLQGASARAGVVKETAVSNANANVQRFIEFLRVSDQ
jgi:hypothetical protein